MIPAYRVSGDSCTWLGSSEEAYLDFQRMLKKQRRRLVCDPGRTAGSAGAVLLPCNRQSLCSLSASSTAHGTSQAGKRKTKMYLDVAQERGDGGSEEQSCRAARVGSRRAGRGRCKRLP